MIEVMNKTQIKFVGTRRVGEASTELLKEVDFAVDTDRSNEGYNQTADEELEFC